MKSTKFIWSFEEIKATEILTVKTDLKRSMVAGTLPIELRKEPIRKTTMYGINILQLSVWHRPVVTLVS